MCMFSVFVHHKLKHLWDCHTINSWKKLIIIYCILIKQSFTLYFFRNGWSELVYPIKWHSHYTIQKMMKWRLVRLVLFSEDLSADGPLNPAQLGLFQLVKDVSWNCKSTEVLLWGVQGSRTKPSLWIHCRVSLSSSCAARVKVVRRNRPSNCTKTTQSQFE